MKLSPLALLCLTSVVAAQHKYLRIEGVDSIASEAFGIGVVFVGDVNGDGVSEIGVSRRTRVDFPEPSGGVFDGRTGDLLYELIPTAGSVGAIVALGDATGDGIPDLAIASPNAAAAHNPGRVWILSGVDGLVATECHDPQFPRTGAVLAAVGDVDGDQRADVAATQAGSGGVGGDGQVVVYSSSTGQVVTHLPGDNAFFGVGLCAFDVDGDGDLELAVSSPFSTWMGKICVYDLPGGGLVWAFAPAWQAFWGRSLALVGDVDGDFIDDLAVTSWYSELALLSGAAGGVIWSRPLPFTPPPIALAGVGDWSGDGVPDVAYERSRPLPGAVLVFSGVDGTLQATLVGGRRDSGFGSSLSGRLDLDGDGHRDLLVGAPHAAVWNDRFSFGVAYAVLRGDPTLGVRHCNPGVSTFVGNPAALLAVGSPAVADDALTLVASGVQPGRFGYLLVSDVLQTTAQPGGSRGVLCLGHPIGRYKSLAQPGSAAGTMTFPVDLAQLPIGGGTPIQPGETWVFQGWFRETYLGQPLTSNFTDALAITFH
jgi:hypothetical protein